MPCIRSKFQIGGICSNAFSESYAYMYEGHKEGVLFTVHEENKGPFTVHEENKSPITVHEDNKHIYSTRVVNS